MKPALVVLTCALAIHTVPTAAVAATLSSCHDRLDSEYRNNLAIRLPESELHKARELRAQAWQEGWVDPELKGVLSGDLVEVSVEGRAYETLRIFPKAGRINPAAKVRLLVLHGYTSEQSNVVAVRKMLRLFTTTGPVSNKSFISQVRKIEGYVEASAEAIDLPGHGAGPRIMSPEMGEAFLVSYLEGMKKETPDARIVVITRSGSGVSAARALMARPELVDGLVMMSVPWPGESEIIDLGLENLRKLAEKERDTLYEPLVAWTRANRLQTSWANHDFAGKPVLAIAGQNDPEVLPIERERLHSLAERLPNVTYIEVPGAGHDTFQYTHHDRSAALASLQATYRIIQAALRR